MMSRRRAIAATTGTRRLTVEEGEAEQRSGFATRLVLVLTLSTKQYLVELCEHIHLQNHQ